jgi:F0F1-type ATP synthase membrane subunit b/b'
MMRKILAGLLLGLSALLFALALFSVGAIWFYKPPLTEDALSRLERIDAELALAQTSLQTANEEIERTLRIVDAAEETLANLQNELAQARALFGEVDETMEGQLLPNMQATRQQISTAIESVQEVRLYLQQLNANPLLSILFPNTIIIPGDDLLASIIAIGFDIDKQIVGMEALVEKASVFLKDASYLMGGDLQETRQNLQNFQDVIDDYLEKLIQWRTQLDEVTTALPGWISTLAIVLTIFLLWFAFSQVSLFLHGLEFWRGGNPLLRLRRNP